MGSCSSKKDDNSDIAGKVNMNCDNSSPINESHGNIQNSSSSSWTNSSNTTYHQQESPTNEDVINSARAEVTHLLTRINRFKGITEDDKNYKYLDEMLTRCILRLDNIECNSKTDRSNRKEAIKDINQAISILERKLEINSDLNKLELNLSET